MFSICTKSIAIGLVAIWIAQGSQSLKAQSAGPLRIEKGTKLALDLDTPVNSGTTREGDAILFRARNDIKAHDRIAIPRGTPIKGTVILVNAAFVNGKPRQAKMQIRLDEILLNNGTVLRLKAGVLDLKSETGGRSLTNAVLQGGAGPVMMGGMLGGLAGRSSRAASIGAIAAIGVGIVGAAKQPRLPGSDVDLRRDAILETRLELALEIPNPALLTGVSLPAPAVPLSYVSAIGTSAGASSSPDGRDPDTSTVAAQRPTIDPTIVVTTNAAPTPASTEAPSAPVEFAGAFTMSVDVNRVLIDAMVRDRGGNPMTNLRREDFRLFEDGVEQPVRDFSRDELPLAVALVIDRSGSVAPLMNRIQNAAVQALQQLKREDTVCLISFATDVELLQELTMDRARVASHIGSIRAGGGTGIVDAVSEALRYRAQTAPDRRRAVILISDNQEGYSRTSLSEAIQLASETDAVVYSVKIGKNAVSLPFGVSIPKVLSPVFQVPTPAYDPVSTITAETGGEVFPTNVTALDAAFATAITHLKLRYTLSYAPQSSNGGYHRVEVRLGDAFGKSGADYTVHSRSGYFGGPARRSGKVGL